MYVNKKYCHLNRRINIHHEIEELDGFFLEKSSLKNVGGNIPPLLLFI